MKDRHWYSSHFFPISVSVWRVLKRVRCPLFPWGMDAKTAEIDSHKMQTSWRSGIPSPVVIACNSNVFNSRHIHYISQVALVFIARSIHLMANFCGIPALSWQALVEQRTRQRRISTYDGLCVRTDTLAYPHAVSFQHIHIHLGKL